MAVKPGLGNEKKSFPEILGNARLGFVNPKRAFPADLSIRRERPGGIFDLSSFLVPKPGHGNEKITPFPQREYKSFLSDRYISDGDG